MGAGDGSCANDRGRTTAPPSPPIAQSCHPPDCCDAFTTFTAPGSFMYVAATAFLPVAANVASSAMTVHEDEVILLDADEFFDGRRGEGDWGGHAEGSVKKGL